MEILKIKAVGLTNAIVCLAWRHPRKIFMSIINRVFGGKPSGEEPKNSQSLVIVPLTEAALPDENWLRAELAKPTHKFRQLDQVKTNQLISQFAARTPAQLDSLLNMVSPIKTRDYKFDNQSVSFSLLGSRDGVEVVLGFATISLMPTPVPGTELYDTCARSWRWPDADEKLQPHTHHWLIVVVTNTPPFQNACIVLRLLGALSSLPEFLGAYIGSAGVVHPPKFIQERVDWDAGTTPANYWVHMETVANEDGTHTFFTHGLHQFGALEIEIVQSRMQYGELYFRGRDLADYVMKAGPVLKHGDTIGATATQKIQVRHEPSVFNPDQTVCRIYH